MPEVELTIEGFSHQGEGIGRHEGWAVFVPGAIPGETVRVRLTEVRKNLRRGEIIEVIKPSAYRQRPVCRHFADCGGCQLQHISYEEQLRLKTRQVEDALTRIGGLGPVPVRPIIGMDEPWRYRNKVEWHSQDGRLGYFAPGSHELLEPADCRLLPAAWATIRETVSDLAKEVRHVVLRQTASRGEMMVILVTPSEKLARGKETAAWLMNRFPQIVSVVQNINPRQTPVIFGRRWIVLGGQPGLRDELAGLDLALSPASFYQVNPTQTRVLYGKVREYAGLSGQETVIDVYCGIGTISLMLAREAQKVYGIEAVPEAVADARRNAELNGLGNAEFIAGPAEEVLPRLAAEGVRPEVLVLDPPRRGCERPALVAIAAMKPARLVYVSCNPATLARDLGYLTEQGYQVAEVQPVDMFPHTAHCETLVQMIWIK